MAKTFMEMVADAQAQVPGISPAEAQQRAQADPNTLIVDVRDSSDIRASGIIQGGHHTSLGTLLFKADQSLPAEWRDPAFNSLDRPILTTCEIGPMAALGAKALKDLGYTNVAFIEGGTQGWIEAGLPTEPFEG
jgi:rhodanese-related sulfurtransferase